MIKSSAISAKRDRYVSVLQDLECKHICTVSDWRQLRIVELRQSGGKALPSEIDLLNREGEKLQDAPTHPAAEMQLQRITTQSSPVAVAAGVLKRSAIKVQCRAIKCIEGCMKESFIKVSDLILLHTILLTCQKRSHTVAATV